MQRANARRIAASVDAAHAVDRDLLDRAARLRSARPDRRVIPRARLRRPGQRRSMSCSMDASLPLVRRCVRPRPSRARPYRRVRTACHVPVRVASAVSAAGFARRPRRARAAGSVRCRRAGGASRDAPRRTRSCRACCARSRSTWSSSDDPWRRSATRRFAARHRAHGRGRAIRCGRRRRRLVGLARARPPSTTIAPTSDTTTTTMTPATIHIRRSRYRSVHADRSATRDRSARRRDGGDELRLVAAQAVRAENVIPPRITPHPTATVAAPYTVTSVD